MLNWDDDKKNDMVCCLRASRAIHLKVANSLSTDSFLMALRRFMARRGHPRELFSDNGTNYRGASTELTNSILCLDQDAIG